MLCLLYGWVYAFCKTNVVQIVALALKPIDNTKKIQNFCNEWLAIATSCSILFY